MLHVVGILVRLIDCLSRRCMPQKAAAGPPNYVFQSAEPRNIGWSPIKLTSPTTLNMAIFAIMGEIGFTSSRGRRCVVWEVATATLTNACNPSTCRKESSEVLCFFFSLLSYCSINDLIMHFCCRWMDGDKAFLY